MYSICMRYSSCKEDADDIFQEAFYLIYKRIDQLKKPEALSGWIKKIFINTALNNLKSKNESSTSDNLDNIINYDNDININTAMSNLGIEELTTLIQNLPSGCRKVFNMYVIDGYSHGEIANKLGISTGTSKSQLHDGRATLKRNIKNKF